MLGHIKAGFRRMLGLHHPGRNLLVYPDDVFIVSYPKSGNTWTRFLIANLLHPEIQTDFGNINASTHVIRRSSTSSVTHAMSQFRSTTFIESAA